MKSSTRLVCMAICAMAVSAVQAQVHRCTDATGKTLYSDLPCVAGQAGQLVERQKSAADIAQERAQANEATDRKYRSQAAERAQADALPSRDAAPTVVRSSNATSAACRDAQKELEFVSSIRTISQDEKRMRANAAITNVNAACGTSTPLMQEPPKIIVRHPTITHCDTGYCYDDAAAVYRKNGPDTLIAVDGRICTRTGSTWTCN